MSGLTWLHISDCHQINKEADPAEFANRQKVLKSLVDDIRNRSTKISPDLEKVDFIIFSGDVANSGKPDQYRIAQSELFRPILDACGLDYSRLFIVPGNHDLDIEMLPADLQRPLKSEEEVHYWLSDEKKRSQALEPLGKFADFVRKFTGQDIPNYANFKKWSIANKEIAVLGLNSAWMCERNKDASGKTNDYGYTVLGELQIDKCFDEIKDADLRIAVFHHPFEWLAEFDRNRIEIPLKRKFHFILNGHKHKPEVQLGFRGTLGEAVSIPAGACYYRRIPSSSLYTNSYNFVHIDSDKNKCFVFLRRWSESRKEWIKDIESYDDNGFYDFDFPWPGAKTRQYTPQIEDSQKVLSKAEHFAESKKGRQRVAITISSEAVLQGSSYSTICCAVEAAKPGDTITLAAGTYYENIQINKSIKIVGTGSDDTIIDGSQAGSVFVVGNKQKNIDVILSGMAIKGGSGIIGYQGQDPNGGGIYNSGRLTVKDCIVSGNTLDHGYGYGGGIYNNEGSLTVIDSTISGNTATGLGGGVYNHAGNLNVINSNIIANIGSGIAEFYGKTIIKNSKILKNSESGIDHNGGRATITDSAISENGHYNSQTATGTIGAGIASYGTITITRCVITDNIGLQAGGICSGHGIMSISDSTISRNSAKWAGGIWADADSTTTITNSKIVENIAKYHGGGIMVNGAVTKLDCDPSQVSGNTPDQIHTQ